MEASYPRFTVGQSTDGLTLEWFDPAFRRVVASATATQPPEALVRVRMVTPSLLRAIIRGTAARGWTVLRLEPSGRALYPWPPPRVREVLLDAGFTPDGLVAWVYYPPLERQVRMQSNVDILGTEKYETSRFPRSRRPRTGMNVLGRTEGGLAVYTGPVPSSGSPFPVLVPRRIDPPAENEAEGLAGPRKRGRAQRAPRSASLDLPGSEVEWEEHYLIPVTRYAQGMSRGMYYDGGEENGPTGYCGTFYYWEPDSAVMLDMGPKGRFDFFVNKVGAALSISDRLLSSTAQAASQHAPARGTPEGDAYRSAMQDRFLGIRLLGDAERVLLDMAAAIDPDADAERSEEIARDLTEYSETGTGNAARTLPFDDDFHMKQDPSHFFPDFYALEDRLDQTLCLAAAAVGIDVLILSKMPGKSRLVTEVMDTRPRLTSVASLVYTTA